mgnify:CR=1 FL=1
MFIIGVMIQLNNKHFRHAGGYSQGLRIPSVSSAPGESLKDDTMKYTKKDIGKATIWYAGNEMVLKAIHPKEGIKHGYTCAPYDCYTYGDGVSYYWVLKGGQS